MKIVQNIRPQKFNWIHSWCFMYKWAAWNSIQIYSIKHVLWTVHVYMNPCSLPWPSRSSSSLVTIFMVWAITITVVVVKFTMTQIIIIIIDAVSRRVRILISHYHSYLVCALLPQIIQEAQRPKNIISSTTTTTTQTNETETPRQKDKGHAMAPHFYQSAIIHLFGLPFWSLCSSSYIKCFSVIEDTINIRIAYSMRT